MKSFYLVIFLILSFNSIGQNRFNQWTISGGATYNLLRGFHKIPFKNYEKSFKFTVGSQLHADWGLMRRVSFGIGATYHRHHLNIRNYEYTSNGVSFIESPTQSIYSMGSYMRFLIHMLSIYEDSGEEIDLYWGAQQEFIFIRTFNTSQDPNFHQFNEEFQAIPCIIGGVRYYPTDNFGIHAEASLPGVYTFSIGLAYRFKNK